MTSYYFEDDKIIFSFDKGNGGSFFGYLIIGIFILIGVISLLLSIFFLFKIRFRISDISPFLIFGLFIGFGFTVAPIYALSRGTKKNIQKNLPKEFIFDNNLKQFIVKEFNGETFVIPYSKLYKIDTRSYVVSGEDSSTTYYLLTLLKKDGAFWDLYRSVNNNEIFTLQEKINSKIKLEEYKDTKGYDEDTQLPEKITQSGYSDYTKFLWSNKYSIAGLVILFIFLGFFWTLLIAMSKHMGVAFYIIGFFLLIFTVIPLFGIYTIFNSILNYHTICIDRDKLSYGLTKKGTNNFKIKKEYDLNLIKKIQFSFNLEYESGMAENREIIILDENSFDMTKNMSKGEINLTNFTDFIRNQTTLFKIPVTGLSVTEILKFEKIIEDEIEKYGGKAE